MTPNGGEYSMPAKTIGRPVFLTSFAPPGQVLPAATKRVALWVFPPNVPAAGATNVTLSDKSTVILGAGINYNNGSAPFLLTRWDTGNWIMNALFAASNNSGISLAFIDVLEQ